MFTTIEEHRTYLSDRARLDAYAAAIRDVVGPGDVVLDLGCGTGILGLLACRAGAAKVYAIDATSMIDVARRLAHENGYSDRIVHLRQMSLDARLSERVDVIVCDQMGALGFDGGVVEYLADARDRFLKPGGRLIPGKLDVVVAPVEAEDLHAQVEFWRSAPAGLEFDCVRQWAANTKYATRFAAGQILGAPVQGKTLDLNVAVPGAFDFHVSSTVQRNGTLHGIAGWFSAELARGVRMTNSPLDGGAIDRHCAFFPLDAAVDVHAGDIVDLKMHVIPLEQVVTWRVAVRRPRGDAAPVQVASFTHSSFFGMLLSTEQLMKTEPAFRPKLTRRGQARVFTLSLFNGDHPLVEIEDSVLARYPDLFMRRDQASAFVRHLVERHTES